MASKSFPRTTDSEIPEALGEVGIQLRHHEALPRVQPDEELLFLTPTLLIGEVVRKPNQELAGALDLE